MDDCDHAGIWHVDLEVAKIRIGEELNPEKALKFYGEKVIPFDDGEKWFIEDFIYFQYGELKPTNNMHLSVISILKKYELFENKGYIRGSGGAKDKDRDKVKDKDKDKVKVQEQKIEIIYPFDSEKFSKHWELWKKFRKENKWKDYQPIGEQAALKKLSNYDEVTACAMIMQSIENGWKGFFELKTNNNGKHRKLDSKKLFGDLHPGEGK